MTDGTSTILVTGGAGFIGSAVVRHLIEHTEHTVINIDKLTYVTSPEALSTVRGNPRYHFYQTDICDSDSVRDIMQRHRPDIVINLAAETHVDRSLDAPGDFTQTNIIGTYRLLECAREYWQRLDGDKRIGFRFHHISTDEVYGELPADAAPFNEDSPYRPSSPYSASKAAADHLVRAWQRSYGLPAIISNCSNNYGPFHFPEKLIPLMITHALSGKPLPLYGDGHQRRDWLYVEDHVDALVLIATRGTPGSSYNVSAINEVSNLEVVRTICALLEELAPDKPDGVTAYEDLITFVADRPGHDSRYALVADKLKAELGWQPRHNFRQGLRDTIEWYLTNCDWWQKAQEKVRPPSFLN